MANKNINWLGNKVVDPNSTYQPDTASTTVNSTTSNEQPQSSIAQDDDMPPYYPYQPSPPYQPGVPYQPVQPYQPIQPVQPVTPYQPGVPYQPYQPVTPYQPGPMFPPDQQGPPPITERGYVPYFLLQNIGKFIRAEFINNNAFTDKAGRLIEVGINYFVLDDINSRAHIMCDLYSARFITVLQPL